MKTPSLKINFAWAFIGNAVYALCGYLLLTILTKTSSVETVGLWGIAQAVTLPIATFFSLRLCTVNITDVRQEYHTGHYIAVRLAASVLSAMVIAVIGFLFYPPQTAAVIAMMGVSQSVAEIRSYFLSNMQKYERLSLATLSQIIEGLLTLLLFGVLFWMSRNLLLAIVGTIVSRLLVLCFYDIPISANILIAHHQQEEALYRPIWHWDVLWKLSVQAAPLAVVAGIGTVFQNIPRIVMDRQIGREAVGYFTAMSMLLVAYTMVNAALGNAALPRLSRYFAENTKAFVWLLIRLMGLNLGLGIVFVAVVFFFGKPLLTLLFTANYAQHKNVLVMLAVSSCLLSVFSVSNWGLNATRRFAVQVPIYIGTAIISGGCSMLLIPRCGIMGGAYAFILSYLFGLSLCLVCIAMAIKHKVCYVE
ncbi:lipopolysaccharide biosynthesis protein [Anaerohalosphaeraceae bacterium U12dextr]